MNTHSHVRAGEGNGIDPHGGGWTRTRTSAPATATGSTPTAA